MAVLTAEQERVFNAWSEEFPSEFRAFLINLNLNYGPSEDPDELIRRLQVAEPGLWLQLITSLSARYAATEADVERAAGRAALDSVEVGAGRETFSTGAVIAERPNMNFSSAVEELDFLYSVVIPRLRQQIEVLRGERETMTTSEEELERARTQGAADIIRQQREREWQTQIMQRLTRPPYTWSQSDARIIAQIVGPLTFGTRIYSLGGADTVAEIVSKAVRLSGRSGVPAASDIQLIVNQTLGV